MYIFAAQNYAINVEGFIPIIFEKIKP